MDPMGETQTSQQVNHSGCTVIHAADPLYKLGTASMEAPRVQCAPSVPEGVLTPLLTPPTEP